MFETYQAKAPRDLPALSLRSVSANPPNISSILGSGLNAHVAALRHTQPSLASTKNLLIGLQQWYGNQYVNRIFRLARHGEEASEVAPDIEQAIDRERGGGAALDQTTQAEMSSAFGSDFAGVRVHTNSTADALNEGVGAVAFTTGQDIFFSAGAYQPRTDSGKALLAHELTHVVQQDGAAVHGKLTLSNPDDASEKDAEQVSDAFRRTAGLASKPQAQCCSACGGECSNFGNSPGSAFVSAIPAEKMQTLREEESAILTEAPTPAGPAVPAPATAPPVSGGCTTQPPAKDPRAIFDNLCLLSNELKNDDRLNDAFHNNPPLTARDSAETIQKFQQALLDAGEKLPNFGADGKWGSETSKAVASFQSKNGIEPGGFEAGRKTLLALDAHLQQNPPTPPNPTPPNPVPPNPVPPNPVPPNPPGPNPVPPNPVPPTPVKTTTLTAQCGSGTQAGTVAVTGTGFPTGPVDLTVDGAGGNSAQADGAGNLAGNVTAKLKDGSHVVEAKSGATHAAAQFNTPCGGPAPPGPADPVTQNELLVLTKYQFLGETERDATEDAIRDLAKDKLDKTPIPFVTTLLEVVGQTGIQFIYGAYEQVLRTAVKGLFPAPSPDPGKQDAGTIVDNAHDKASDFLEDFGKDGLAEAIKEEHEAPVKAVADQLEAFRRGLLAGLRKGYFELSVNWIQKVHADPGTKDITAAELQGLAQGLDLTGQNIYQLRYNQVVQAWASYIAQARPGAKPNLTTKPDPNQPGKLIQVSVTSLPRIDSGAEPQDHPGVLFIHIFSDNVKPKLATAIMQVGSDADIVVNPAHIDQNDIHIFGLSEDTRNSLSASSPNVGSLAIPVVLRGNSVDGGEVAIYKDEAGNIRDLSKDPKGSEWLAGVGQDFSNERKPDAGAKDLFDEGLNAPIGKIAGP